MVRLISPHIVGPQHQRLWTCNQTCFLSDEGSHTFSVKRQLVNILAFAGHKVSITNVNSATGLRKQPQRNRHERLWLHSNKTLFTKPGGGLDLACASSVLGLLWRLSGNPPANAGDVGSIRLGRSPGEGDGNLLQCSCLEKSYRQRSLPSYSSWGRKELATEHMPGVLTFAFYYWLLIPLLPGLSAVNPRCYAILPVNIPVKISKGKRKTLNINHYSINMITPKILRIISFVFSFIFTFDCTGSSLRHTSAWA